MRCLMNKMEALQVRRIPPGVWAVPGWGCPQSGYFGAAELHVCYRILLELHQVPSPQAPGALGCPLQQRGGWRFASGPPTKWLSILGYQRPHHRGIVMTSTQQLNWGELRTAPFGSCTNTQTFLSSVLALHWIHPAEICQWEEVAH